LRKEYSLKELAEFLDGVVVKDTKEIINNIVSTGKHNNTGSIFVAYKGVEIDGHRFIPQAFKNGSVATIVTDKNKLGAFPGILVDNSKLALSKLSALFNDFPSKKLLTIGITGTNGKTTIHWILAHALEKLNFPSLRIGSLGIDGGQIHHSGKALTKTGQIFMTTPGAFEIQCALKEAVDKKMKATVIETSSHALDQYRVSDVYYDTAVFTNLTPEHLNYHKDIEDYFCAKVKLFKQLSETKKAKFPKNAIINSDCPYGKRLIKICKDFGLDVISYGFGSCPTIKIERFVQNFEKSILELSYKSKRYEISTSLIGNYNGSNIAAAFGALVSNGFPPSESAIALSDIPSVPGRLESLGTKEIGIYVDYAHTGDGLENVLSALKPFAKNRLWVIFGCGGGKDPGKRIAMGNAAKKYADNIVLTNDNPKLENPEKIVDDILKSGCKPYFVEYDRAKAIEKALNEAKNGDVFILAGKGHEDYQIIGTKTIAFSDKEEVIKWKLAKKHK